MAGAMPATASPPWRLLGGASLPPFFLFLLPTRDPRQSPWRGTSGAVRRSSSGAPCPSCRRVRAPEGGRIAIKRHRGGADFLCRHPRGTAAAGILSAVVVLWPHCPFSFSPASPRPRPVRISLSPLGFRDRFGDESGLLFFFFLLSRSQDLRP
jgi:hypothetical protein